MESNETLSFDMDTAGVERQARVAAAALNGLKKAAVSLGGAVTAALFGTQALADSADNAPPLPRKPSPRPPPPPPRPFSGL